jgi:hypothetical protein
MPNNSIIMDSFDRDSSSENPRHYCSRMYLQWRHATKSFLFVNDCLPKRIRCRLEVLRQSRSYKIGPKSVLGNNCSELLTDVALSTFIGKYRHRVVTFFILTEPSPNGPSLMVTHGFLKLPPEPSETLLPFTVLSLLSLELPFLDFLWTSCLGDGYAVISGIDLSSPIQ